jgi:hypothetical protein
MEGFDPRSCSTRPGGAAGYSLMQRVSWAEFKIGG